MIPCWVFRGRTRSSWAFKEGENTYSGRGGPGGLSMQSSTADTERCSRRETTLTGERVCSER